MRIPGKRRLLLAAGSAATLGAVATLVSGVTFGLFSASESSGNNTFTAGTVTVAQPGSPADVVCTIGPMSAGDTEASGTNAACTFNVQYTGSVPAWLGMDVAVTGTAGTPVAPYGGSAPTAAQGLYDDTANGLQLKIVDDQSTPVTYISDGAGGKGTKYFDVANAPTDLTVSGSPNSGSVTDLLVSTSAVSATWTHKFTVTYTLPSTATNAYQAAATKLVLTFHAVQSNNNALPGACTHVGAQCSTLTWS